MCFISFIVIYILYMNFVRMFIEFRLHKMWTEWYIFPKINSFLYLFPKKNSFMNDKNEWALDIKHAYKFFDIGSINDRLLSLEIVIKNMFSLIKWNFMLKCKLKIVFYTFVLKKYDWMEARQAYFYIRKTN